MNMYRSNAFGRSAYDTLADYLGGALDGTPEAATVIRRIADDPAWRAAYDELRAADAAVRSDLSLFAAAELPPAPELIFEAPKPVRRRSQFALAGGAAGLVVLAAAGAMFALSNPTRQAAPSAESAHKATAPVAPSSAPGLVAPKSPVPTASDGGLNRNSLLGTPDPGDMPSSRDPDPVFDRVREPAAMADCLREIAARHPGAVTAKQFTVFEGKPAMLVTVKGPGGLTSVVVGPNCGLAGADEVFSTPQR